MVLTVALAILLAILHPLTSIETTRTPIGMILLRDIG